MLLEERDKGLGVFSGLVEPMDKIVQMETLVVVHLKKFVIKESWELFKFKGTQ